MEETGSTLSERGHGALSTVRTPKNVQLVREAVERSPRRSARKHAIAMGISDRSLRRIVHDDLSFRPYKSLLVQEELSAVDNVNRKNRCWEMLQKIPPTAIFFCSDEAHFLLSETVDKQNFRYRAKNNPRKFHETPLRSPKVWCSVSQYGVIGPYFFEENNMTVNVTSARYVVTLEIYLKKRLDEMAEEHDLGDVWFLQDGPTAHTAQISLAVLQKIFPRRLVPVRGDIGWPARSSDLSIGDFSLWSSLKDTVFRHHLHTVEDLKEKITEETCRKVFINFRDRLQKCIGTNVRHLEDIIFKR